MESLSPMGRPSAVKDITDAVIAIDVQDVTGDRRRVRQALISAAGD